MCSLPLLDYQFSIVTEPVPMVKVPCTFVRHFMVMKFAVVPGRGAKSYPEVLLDLHVLHCQGTAGDGKGALEDGLAAV